MWSGLSLAGLACCWKYTAKWLVASLPVCEWQQTQSWSRFFLTGAISDDLLATRLWQHWNEATMLQILIISKMLCPILGCAVKIEHRVT